MPNQNNNHGHESCLNFNIIDNNNIDQESIQGVLEAILDSGIKKCLCNINYMDSEIVEGVNCPCFFD